MHTSILATNLIHNSCLIGLFSIYNSLAWIATIIQLSRSSNRNYKRLESKNWLVWVMEFPWQSHQKKRRTRETFEIIIKLLWCVSVIRAILCEKKPYARCVCLLLKKLRSWPRKKKPKDRNVILLMVVISNSWFWYFNLNFFLFFFFCANKSMSSQVCRIYSKNCSQAISTISKVVSSCSACVADSKTNFVYLFIIKRV